MLKDRWIWGAVLAGLALRLLPMVLWPQTECVRDECVYRFLANGILQDGELGVTTKGWLAAPGYPYLLALFRWATGSWFTIKWLQIALSTTSIPVMAAIAGRIAPHRPERAARWAAWLFAVHPTLAWYPSTWWIEPIYISLLLPAVWLVLEGHRRPTLNAGIAGVLLGVAILFRGVATYLPPIFALSMLVREGDAPRAKPIAALLLGVVLTVTPYSLFASSRYGGFLVSDATMGHVLYLGNNVFPPMTFDYGNGVLTQDHFYDSIRRGRKPCDRKLPPVRHSRCDTSQAIAWAKGHPDEFIGRIPLRLAQQMNPHSFFTRQIRWGHVPLEGLTKELAVLFIALFSGLTVLGGTLGACASARGRYGRIAAGVIAYTMLTAAVSYGMSRFRLPLEPLWLVWLAVLLAAPRAVLAELKQPMRAGLALVLLPVLAGLMSWFAATGFPALWR